MLSNNNSGFSHIWKGHRRYGRSMSAAVLVLGLFISHCWARNPAAQHTIFVNETPIKVEIADNKTARSRGLMHRETLATDAGMLFIFDEPDYLRFWMKDTPLDLDIGFFDENRHLFQIEQMKAFDDATIHTAHAPAVFVLEVNRGWFAKNRIRPGALLRLTDEVNDGLK